AGCGKAIAFQNVDGWANAIAEILSDRKVESKMRKNSQALSQEFTWEICSRRLKEYCRNPHHLPEFQKVKMPSIIERAQAVYSRGGKDMVLKRSAEMINDLLR